MNKIDSIKEAIDSEVEYFDDLATLRFSRGLPCEADMRTTTVYKPKTIHEEIIDAKLKKILLEPQRGIALKALFDSPKGNLLDVCCGPGWFCLEAAREGRDITGYDISVKALSLAKHVYEKNKPSISGEINYVNKSVEEMNFRGSNVSGVMGWSAFHHLQDPGKFLDHIYEILPIGGVVVTLDDLHSYRPAKIMRYLFKFLLPIYEHTYLGKLSFILSILLGKNKLNEQLHSPMEVISDKHGAAAEVIRDKMINRFHPIYDLEFGAFSIYVGHSLKGPNIFRHLMARIVTKIDSIFCAIGLCKGSYRIIVSVKK